MIHAIKNVFKSNLDSMEWMDEVTKTYAKRKVNMMKDSLETFFNVCGSTSAHWPILLLVYGDFENFFRGLIILLDFRAFDNSIEKVLNRSTFLQTLANLSGRSC